ncbi:MAG: hypothetical protein P1V13_03660 [Rhizobiaceae bacterium]|nr:hypothetical protein [Rhizobiaceae bacterium]
MTKTTCNSVQKRTVKLMAIFSRKETHVQPRWIEDQRQRHCSHGRIIPLTRFNRAAGSSTGFWLIIPLIPPEAAALRRDRARRIVISINEERLTVLWRQISSRCRERPFFRAFTTYWHLFMNQKGNPSGKLSPARLP